MKQLYLLLLIMVVASCHSTRKTTTNVESIVDSTSRQYAYNESIEDISLLDDISLSLDSFDIWIDPIVSCGTPTDTTMAPRTNGNALSYSIHIRAKHAEFDKGSSAKCNTINRTQQLDSTELHSNIAQQTSADTDTVSVAKPPNLTWIFSFLIIATVFIILVILKKSIY